MLGLFVGMLSVNKYGAWGPFSHISDDVSDFDFVTILAAELNPRNA